MKVTAHQEKEENEETKKGRQKEKKQATNFKEAVCCPSAVVQGQHSKKIKGSAQGSWDP